MLLQSIDQRSGEFFIHSALFSNQDQPSEARRGSTNTQIQVCIVAYALEGIMHPASHSVSLQTQIHILATSIISIILVQNIIQTLIKVLQVEKHDCASGLHTYLDLVNILANLQQR